ncbi:oligosaccharide flippase family protein [Patescibacteria group bacterium]|nr:oligosaccharide flippase family protein [Patescibacteria group bacterium]
MNPLKLKLLKLIENQLIAGSAILFAGNMFANFGNYLYHLLMGRMLGPIDYGILASLISFSYLISIPVNSLSLVVVKYVSALRGKKDFGTIFYFYSWLNKKLVIFSLAGFLLLIIISPLIASFLHLKSILPLLLIITSSLVGVYFMVNVTTLQGFLRFGLMSISGAVQVVLKLGIAVLLVYLGWKVLGAVLAFLVSALIGYLLTAFFVRRLFERKKERKKTINSQEIVRYAVPVFFSTLAFTSLYTTDIVLVRHFLPAQEAGFYAALATLGKIIFFASSPIIMVMFPMVSERHANGKKYINLLSLSLGLVLLTCLGISGIYFLFPKLMINILYGRQYLSASPYLFLFAIFLSLYSLSSLLVNFYLSVKKVKVVVLPVIAAAAQVILIFLFHQSLSQIVWVSISILSLLLISLLVYYIYSDNKTKKAPTFSYRSRL